MPPSRPHRGRRSELAVALAIDGRQHRDIAASAGLAPQTLSRILSGRIRDPRPQTRHAIASALGRTPEEIFPEYTTAAPADTDDVAGRVRAQRVAQGLPPEPTDDQLAFVGAVIAGDLRRLNTADK
jgi:transcriptional regulator with XRE-family HTH domain